MRLLILSCLALSLSTTHAFAQAVFVRVLDNKARVRVGTLVNETKDQIEIHELSNDTDVSIPKSEVKKIEKGDDVAIAAIGIPKVAAVRVTELAGRTNATGKVARVTQNVIYITLGEKSGIGVKQKLNVYRNQGEIRDPDTNKLLGVERSKVGVIEITEVNQDLSKAKMVSELEVTLKSGDEVEEARTKLKVAVLPFRTESGRQDETGSAMAEEITTALARSDVQVFERSLIDKVLVEQVVQNTVLFEAEPTQRIGHLLGASAVLTGKVVSKDKDDLVYVRLIDVETGRILFAASGSVKRSSSSTSSSSKGSSSSSSGGGTSTASKSPSKKADDDDGDSSSSSNTNSRPSDGKWIDLGGRNKFPALLQGSKEVQSEKKGLTIRRRNYVLTKKGDYLTQDFRFEIVFTLPEGNANDIMYIGLGEADRNTAYNEPKNSVYMTIQPPNMENGRVNVSNKTGGGVSDIGKVSHVGTHRAIIEKIGDVVTFMVDVDNDGESDDDIEHTIPDIKAFGPYLHKKNTYLFFGGGGVYQKLRLGPPEKSDNE